MDEPTGPPGLHDVMHFVYHKWKTNIVWAGALYSLWKQYVQGW